MLCQLRKNTRTMRPNAKESAFLDWGIIRLHTGYHLSEWANTSNPRNMGDFTMAGKDKSKYRQCIGLDWLLLGKEGKFLSKAEALAYDPAQLTGAQTCFRYQKNEENGQHLSFSPNRADPDFCVPRAVQRIKQRRGKISPLGTSSTTRESEPILLPWRQHQEHTQETGMPHLLW
jgi:hypothetical protein